MAKGTFDSMKVAELKEQCRACSLKVSGSKQELIERLKHHRRQESKAHRKLGKKRLRQESRSTQHKHAKKLFLIKENPALVVPSTSFEGKGEQPTQVDMDLAPQAEPLLNSVAAEEQLQQVEGTTTTAEKEQPMQVDMDLAPQAEPLLASVAAEEQLKQVDFDPAPKPVPVAAEKERDETAAASTPPLCSTTPKAKMVGVSKPHEMERCIRSNFQDVSASPPLAAPPPTPAEASPMAVVPPPPSSWLTLPSTGFMKSTYTRLLEKQARRPEADGVPSPPRWEPRVRTPSARRASGILAPPPSPMASQVSTMASPTPARTSSPYFSSVPSCSGNLQMKAEAHTPSKNEVRIQVADSRQKVLQELTSQMQLCLSKLSAPDLQEQSREKYQDLANSIKKQLDKLSSISLPASSPAKSMPTPSPARFVRRGGC